MPQRKKDFGAVNFTQSFSSGCSLVLCSGIAGCEILYR